MAPTTDTKYFPSDSKQLMSVTRDGPLFILTMLDNENRFTKEFCGGICDALDYVSDIVDKEDLKEAALITRGGAEKFYSNGLHFEKALAIPNFPEDIFMPMLHKILMFSLPTVACINGHAFAGGMLMAMTHDYRVMRSDRGFMCMNEIDLPAPLPTGMSALLRYKLPHHVYRSVVLEARRYSAKDALASHIVDAIPDKEGVDAAFELAKTIARKVAPKAKAGSIIGLIKEDMYPEVAAFLLNKHAKL
ncbi:ClpP/crotonase-like domain-containing protein [Lobosporangium transversale]|uniref:ClpP/crotonase-like domain-containing protein n=1 Tax=Lobosporangium transversale TaxID=64571 RepID=A0A1Y2GWK9_9FUNG|nr:ClpP/crotonase-like domain-containing protein [Lobosporangium transversale]ORZ26649.1 ClpP/crotonase-like domain-containing protein [Lobosporangium transversale]|eukprot:XP_021884412.1 ClpP/crotonase-like domain-containing protein [Lobosporangium transversale]